MIVVNRLNNLFNSLGILEMTIRPLSLSKLHKFIKDFIIYYVKGILDILITFLFDSIIVKTHKGLNMISLGLIQKVFGFYPMSILEIN